MGLEEAREVFGRERTGSAGGSDRLRLIRDRVANAERSDFCMREFLAYARDDIEWLLENNRVATSCDQCDEYADKLEDAEIEINRWENENDRLDARNMDLEEENKRLEEQIAELKDSLKQLTFRGGL